MDYYQLLGVEYDAPPGKIRARYRLLARRLHPDGQNLGTAETFTEITKAYRALFNLHKRSAYNHELGISVQPRALHPGIDIYQRIFLTEAQAASGTETALNFVRYEPCRQCWLGGCDGCQGHGMIPETVVISIRVYPNTKRGSTIFLEGLGSRGEPGGARGNLIVYIDSR
jgi:DnaJ-class molecular chaperone